MKCKLLYYSKTFLNNTIKKGAKGSFDYLRAIFSYFSVEIIYNIMDSNTSSIGRVCIHSVILIRKLPTST